MAPKKVSRSVANGRHAMPAAATHAAGMTDHRRPNLSAAQPPAGAPINPIKDTTENMKPSWAGLAAQISAACSGTTESWAAYIMNKPEFIAIIACTTHSKAACQRQHPG